MLSTRSQMTLSGLEDIGVGLPPASPSEHETAALVPLLSIMSYTYL